MREIKFRAWDGNAKKMYFADSKQFGFQFRGDGNWAFNDYGTECVYTSSLKGGVLMQYTGIKDKNGKEIYEGDVTRRGVIVFERGKFQGYYFDSNGNLNEAWEDDLYLEQNIEVIGNIYENEELLK